MVTKKKVSVEATDIANPSLDLSLPTDDKETKVEDVKEG
jgi:hypothetical protein